MNAILQFPGRPSPTDLLSEVDILRLRPCLGACTLRAARKARQITFTRGKRQTAWYRLADVDAFIAEKLEQRCHDRNFTPSSNSADNGSTGHTEPRTSTDIGLTPELAEHVANRLAQQI